MSRDVTIYIIDDDASVRTALDNFLRSAGLRVLLFESPEQFLAVESADAAGCIVLDVRLPEQNGLDFQNDLAAHGSHMPIIFITGHGDIPMSVRAMKAGAVEFLTKPFSEQALLDAIHVALKRDEARRAELKLNGELLKRFQTLTRREREVMSHVVRGRFNKQIAADLKLSEITVKVHRGHLMRKMKVKTVAELVRIADRISDERRTSTIMLLQA